MSAILGPSVGALGNPLHFKLTDGQRRDGTQAEARIADYKGAFVIADKSYNSTKWDKRRH